MFPDVSSWQGYVNWPAVAGWQRAHGWSTGGVFKMGEYGVDPQASSNSLGTRSLSWRSGYWYIRNTGCQHEANQIAAGARAYGLRLVWLDLESPEARGYGLCLTPPLRRVGLVVGEYTSPGTNPGGVDTSDPLWQATYGSGFSPIWHPVVAWQCTDGHYGCRTYVPGIGYDDVSIDFGIARLFGPPPPPPDPLAIMDHTLRHFGRDTAREFQTAHAWKDHHCLNPVRRGVCKSTRAHLVNLSGRLWFVAHHRRDAHGRWHTLSHGDWTGHRGERFQIMWGDLHQMH